MAEAPRLDPNAQPDFTTATLQQLELLDKDLAAQGEKIKNSMVKDWPLSRILVVGGLLTLGILTTVSNIESGKMSEAFASGIATGMLAVLAAAGTVIAWWVDLLGVRENRKILREVTPVVALREATFDRDDQAELN